MSEIGVLCDRAPRLAFVSTPHQDTAPSASRGPPAVYSLPSTLEMDLFASLLTHFPDSAAPSRGTVLRR